MNKTPQDTLDSLVFYTDGTRMEASSSLEHTTVFEEKVRYILPNTDVTRRTEQKLDIWCDDSQVEVKVICSPRTRNTVIQECAYAHNKGNYSHPI